MKTIDFTKRKPTDYKLNRNIILPRPLQPDLELQCELRRRNYIKAFEDYEAEIVEAEGMTDVKRIKPSNNLIKVIKSFQLLRNF